VRKLPRGVAACKDKADRPAVRDSSESRNKAKLKISCIDEIKCYVPSTQRTLGCARETAKGNSQHVELRSLEDKYTEDLVDKQKKNGLRAITDGDFRRGHRFIDFLVGLEGVTLHLRNLSQQLGLSRS
jgi:hypothetical protein